MYFRQKSTTYFVYKTLLNSSILYRLPLQIKRHFEPRRELAYYHCFQNKPILVNSTIVSMKMVIYFLLGISLYMCMDSARAQSIATDRPDQTECPSIVPKGMFQLETGFQYEADKQDSVRLRNFTYCTSLIKYGISDYAEIRLIIEYSGDTQLFASEQRQKSHTSGLSPVAVGMKLAICEEKGIIPKTSLIVHADLPYFGSPEVRPKSIVPRFRFTMSHSLSDRTSLSYNLGAEWNEADPIPTHIYTLTLGRNLSDKWGMYLESYGFLNKNLPTDHRVDGGVTYLITNNLQLDASAGVGLTAFSPNSFVGFGCSWRFKR